MSSIKRKIRHFRSRAKTGKEMYKKACKVLVLLIKPFCWFFFLTFSLPSASLDLKVPNKLAGKRDSRRGVIPTTSFSENVVVAERSYQM